MADDSSSSEDEKPLTFNIKSSSNAKYTLSLPPSTTVLELKSKLSGSEYANLPADRQRLIYSGRVLKDPDTLESYKIRDGHTVHMVPSAASNLRQNPANAGSTTASSLGAGSAGAGAGAGAGVAGVPSNLATGTGNNPLAGLTGARYAGLAQLPGAGMFGPDGGVSLTSLSNHKERH
jgi:ubiquilin